MQKVALVVLGPQNTGKSSLIKQFIYGKFFTNYEPTIEETFKKDYHLKGFEFNLNIFDTAGQEEYHFLRNETLKNGQAFILMYSIDDYESFLECQNIYQDYLKQYEENDVPIILVGNKCDLEDRQVSEDEAREWTQNTIPKSSFIETSAKKGLNVSDVFQETLKFFLPKEDPRKEILKEEPKLLKEKRKSFLVQTFEKLTNPHHHHTVSSSPPSNNVNNSQPVDNTDEKKRKRLSIKNIFSTQPTQELTSPRSFKK